MALPCDFCFLPSVEKFEDALNTIKSLNHSCFSFLFFCQFPAMNTSFFLYQKNCLFFCKKKNKQTVFTTYSVAFKRYSKIQRKIVVKIITMDFKLSWRWIKCDDQMKYYLDEVVGTGLRGMKRGKTVAGTYSKRE